MPKQADGFIFPRCPGNQQSHCKSCSAGEQEKNWSLILSSRLLKAFYCSLNCLLSPSLVKKWMMEKEEEAGSKNKRGGQNSCSQALRTDMSTKNLSVLGIWEPNGLAIQWSVIALKALDGALTWREEKQQRRRGGTHVQNKAQKLYSLHCYSKREWRRGLTMKRYRIQSTSGRDKVQLKLHAFGKCSVARWLLAQSSLTVPQSRDSKPPQACNDRPDTEGTGSYSQDGWGFFFLGHTVWGTERHRDEEKDKVPKGTKCEEDSSFFTNVGILGP